MEGTVRYDKLKEQLFRFKSQGRDWLHVYQWQAVGIGLLIVFLQCGEVQFAVNGFWGPPRASTAFGAGEPAGAVALPISWKVEDKAAKILPAKKLSWDEVASAANAGKEKENTAVQRWNKPEAKRGSKLERQLRYIERFKDVARTEMDKYGIPASITLAQGLLESDAGKSTLAGNHNNHFGIKCFDRRCSPGHCVNYSDDSHKDFFRSFPNAWESFRAHSVFLQRDRYKGLHKLSSRDYKNWAHGLQRAGYATDPSYGDKLIRLIEALDLHVFDS